MTDLRTIAPPDGVEVLDDQLELLASATEAAMVDERDVESALRPDSKGIGVAAAATGPRGDVVHSVGQRSLNCAASSPSRLARLAESHEA